MGGVNLSILLLIPPASLDDSYGELKDFSNPQPSIGLAYIAAVLRKNGFKVSILDCYVRQLTLDKIMSEIGNLKPNIIGISVLTTGVDVVMSITHELRQNFPQVKILLGNIHASIFAEKLLTDNVADFIVHREGEYSVLKIAQALQNNNNDYSQIPGISYRHAGIITHTTPGLAIETLDDLPVPAWDLFPLELYGTDPRTQVIPGETEVQILATRGCPNACTFCSSHMERSLGSKYRMRSPQNIVDELEFMMQHYHAKVFSFMDLAFPLVRAHAEAVCAEIERRGIAERIAWVTECRVKPLDIETLKAMKAAGCVRINFGIESGVDSILKSLKKNFTVDDVRQAVRFARESGIEVDGMFMIGLPNETEQDIIKTIEFSLELDLRYAIFNIFVPYPGCELYEELNSQNKIHYSSWSDFTSYPTYGGKKPVYVPDGITHERLMELQKTAMRKFYFRPRFLWSEMKRFRPAKLRQYLSGLTALIKK